MILRIHLEGDEVKKEIKIGSIRQYGDASNLEGFLVVCSADQEGDLYLYACKVFHCLSKNCLMGAKDRKLTEDEVLIYPEVGNIHLLTKERE